jgi:hypothetical protein
MLLGGALVFAASAGGDFIASGGDLSKIDWGKAVIMGTVGVITAILGTKLNALSKSPGRLVEIVVHGNNFVMITTESSKAICRQRVCG